MEKNYDGTVSEAQAKGRQTKLSKKSSEELIDIILRKDKTERLNASTIKNLKTEINKLKESNSNLCRNVQDAAGRNTANNKTIAELRGDIKAANNAIEVYSKQCVEYANLAKSWKTAAFICLGLLFVSVICVMI